MGLTRVKEFLKVFRHRLAITIFGILLVWPLFHMVLVNNSPISSWRFFGWGMYATPNPEAVARLAIVIPHSKKNQTLDAAWSHSLLEKLGGDEMLVSDCVNLFAEAADGSWQRLPTKGLCQNRELARELDHILYFGSTADLAQFTQGALARALHPQTVAYGLVTRQRLNLLEGQSYLESDVYRVAGGKGQFLATITK